MGVIALMSLERRLVQPLQFLHCVVFCLDTGVPASSLC